MLESVKVEARDQERPLPAGEYIGHNPLRCLFCQSLFASNLSLDTHIQSVHKYVRKCRECSVYFKNTLDKEKHLEDVHTETPLKCIYCDQVFSKNNEQLRRHMKDCHSGVTTWRCYYGCCMKEFFTIGERSNHFSRAHYTTRRKTKKKKIDCIYKCKETFFTTKSLTLHLEIQHNGIFFGCDYKKKCASYFKNKDDLAEHVKNLHETFSNTGSRIECIYCSRKICSSQLQNHMKEYHKDNRVVRCRYPLCPTYFRSEQERQEHEANVHSADIANNSITCRFCQMTIASVLVRQQHFKHYHKTESISICKYKGCLYYGLTKDVQNHCKEIHESNASRIKCIYCGHFYAKGFLGTHVKSKHESQAIKCKFQCRTYFLSEGDRDEHIVNVHSKALVIRDFICIYCNKSYFSPSSFHLHVHQVHTEIYIRCNLRGCKEYFLSQSDKNKHYLEMHQEKEAKKSLKCINCNYKTVSKRHLREHIERKHNKAKVPCPKCSKIFKSQSFLDVHVRRVHLKKHTKCEYCNKLMKNIRRHQRRMECENCQNATHCIVKARQHISACKGKNTSVN